VTIATTCARVLTDVPHEPRAPPAGPAGPVREPHVRAGGGAAAPLARAARRVRAVLTAVASTCGSSSARSPSPWTGCARAPRRRAGSSADARQMRELSQLLCPPVLGLYGLVPSLETLCRDFGERHDIGATFAATTCRSACRRRSRRPSTASRRRPSPTWRGTRAPGASAWRSPPPGRAPPRGGRRRRRPPALRHAGGIGLTGIAERVRALGGDVAIESSRGTQLLVSIPSPASRPPSPPDGADPFGRGAGHVMTVQCVRFSSRSPSSRRLHEQTVPGRRLGREGPLRRLLGAAEDARPAGVVHDGRSRDHGARLRQALRVSLPRASVPADPRPRAGDPRAAEPGRRAGRLPLPAPPDVWFHEDPCFTVAGQPGRRAR
jgi:hypothetical protein